VRGKSQSDGESWGISNDYDNCEKHQIECLQAALALHRYQRCILYTLRAVGHAAFAPLTYIKGRAQTSQPVEKPMGDRASRGASPNEWNAQACHMPGHAADFDAVEHDEYL